MLFSRATISGSIASGAILLWVAFAGCAYAQMSPRSLVASPDIYKVVERGDKCLVIEATWAPGQRDEFHSDAPGAIYWVTACKTREFLPTGRSRDSAIRAGTYLVIGRPVSSHSVKNIGGSACKAVVFEHK